MTAWQNLVEQTIQATGLELVHVELLGAGRAQTLRVYVDQPGGVGLDDCERASRALSAALDAALEAGPAETAGAGVVPLADSYTLEVSSPGVDRPLVKPADFERFAGERARVDTRTVVAGSRHFLGRLCGAGDDGVKLETEAGAEVVIGWDNVHKARLAPRWPEPGAKPGGQRIKSGRGRK